MVSFFALVFHLPQNFNTLPHPCLAGASLVAQSRVDESLLRLRLLDSMDSSRVKGVTYVRALLGGKIPPWTHMAWFSQQFNIKPGNAKPGPNDNILEALEHFSKIKLAKHWVRFDDSLTKKHKQFAGAINSQVNWSSIPSILADLCYSFCEFCSGFLLALKATLLRLPAGWASVLPQNSSFKVSIHHPNSMNILIDPAFLAHWHFSPTLFVRDLKYVFLPF